MVESLTTGGHTLGYSKICEAKFVKVRHKITFTEGTRAIDLMVYLRNVPPAAIVVEVIDDNEEGETIIEFHEVRSL